VTTTGLVSIFGRRAALLRELASLEERLSSALADLRPVIPDEELELKDAAQLMGEKPSTFRRKPEYLKARLRRPSRRLRYSRAALERIKLDRLAGLK
jgi:hypothetical protein